MDSIVQQMRQFHQSSTTAKLREQMRQKTLLDIWGVGRRENGHSNFLAWLLTPEVSHDLGDFALQKMLLLLASCQLSPEQQLPESIHHAVLAGKNITRSARVEREVAIPPNGRVDIVATIELSQELAGIKHVQIVLENKIDAAETDHQTIRYYQHFSAQKEEGLCPIFVYLSRIGARPKRYFIAADELIPLKSGELIAVSSQCGGGTSLINFDGFVKKAEELGFVITEK